MQGKRSKAVSPVLATLLMIAVAVSLSVIIFMWSQNFLASTSQAASTQQQSQNVAAQSSIAIESVGFPATNNVRIIVRNVGTTKVTLGGLYVNNSVMQLKFKTGSEAYPDTANQANWYAYDKNHNPQSSSEIPPQGYASIRLNYNWSAGGTYIIKVTTTAGTFAETVVTAPA